MRVSEAKHLTWDLVDLEAKRLRVRPGRAVSVKFTVGCDRDVPLSDGSVALLRGLPRLSLWVFSAPFVETAQIRDRPISEARAESELKKVLNTLRLAGHLHSFRFSMLTHARSSPCAETTLREWAGLTD